jgi:3,4-dihydroxy 2-butanone 4-phosphate synthase/GTP cyclohydrolase II
MADATTAGFGSAPGFSTIDHAVERIAAGGMAIVVDSHDRENEGDLVMAAAKVTPDAVNFMATHGRGLICVPMARERLAALAIAPMVDANTDPHGTAFHVSVDLRRGTTTGISSSDRSATIRALADHASRGEEFTRPGHVFPLASRAGGVLERAGHTEAAVDLATLAGLSPAGVICEIAAPNGEMARLPLLLELAATHDLPVVSIADLIVYRRRREQLVVRRESARLPIAGDDWIVTGYQDLVDGGHHMIATLGDVRSTRDVLVRVHSECLTGDVFGSQRCDCGEQLRLAQKLIAAEGCGAVVYLRGHEGRGIGLLDKIHAYRLQDDEGLDTVEANIRLGHPPDRRDYGIGMQILADQGIDRLRLLTNNPDKRFGLEAYGLEICERVPLVVASTPSNVRYLKAKETRMGHLLAPEHAAR